MIKFIIAVCISIMLCSVTAQSSTFAEENPKEQTADPCRTILETKCSTCHYLSRVCQKLGNRNKRNWKKTIKRMVDKGAKLSSQQQDELTNCLYEQTEGVLAACK